MLITIEDLQNFTNVYPEDEKSQQDLYIGQQSDIIYNYLGYNPNLKDYEKYFNGNDSNEIFIGVKHINKINELKINNNLIDANGYQFDDDVVFLLSNSIFEKGIKNIKINFNAGYENIPNIIKLTALRIAGVLQTESDNNIGITSKSFQIEGNRTFVNTTNFDRYLLPLSKYKLCHQ